METKMKYSPNGIAIAEMVCSAILVIAIFLPWVRMEALGESKEFALTEHGVVRYIYGAVFVFNIILKFFKRSRWMSAIVAIVAILMHTEVGAKAYSSNASDYSLPFRVQYEPAIGEQIVLLVGLILMFIVFLPWMTSKWHSIVEAHRSKQSFNVYASSLGLFFLCCLFLVFIGIGFTGSSDEFFKDNDNPYVMVVGGFFVIGMFIFFCWGVIGCIVWLIRRMHGGTGEPAKVASSDGDGAMTSPSNKPVSRKNRIIGIVIVVLFLLMCVSHLRTCSISSPDSDTPATEISDNTTDDSETAVEQYIVFEENGKSGVKKSSGEVIIPAEYMTGSFDINDNSITAFEAEGEQQMVYFKKTGQMLSHIDAAYGGIEGVTLYHFADNDTHAFYTEDGQLKASGLSGDIFCLRQLDPQTGYDKQVYYGFRDTKNVNGDYMPVYDKAGNRICAFTVNGWQLFGLEHLERNDDEPRDFEKEYTFTIDFHDFISANKSVIHF